MSKEIMFKGQKAIEFENSQIKVIVLPNIGGKIASIYHKGKKFELVFQNKEEVYNKPELYSSFEKFDAAGFDDAFPTIDQCKISYSGKEIIYPDHGEIWAGSFEIEDISNNKIKLKYNSKILPYIYYKTIELKDYNDKLDNKKNKITISYNIENNGLEKLPSIFAAHFLVNCHEDMEIRFPKGTEYVVNVQPSERLGKVGTVHKLLSLGTVHKNLSKVLPKNSNNTEKYYVKDKVNEGRCSIFYNHVNLEYILKYDKEQLPYLGFWVTEGGFRGDYNCALEPTNGYYDNIDIARKEEALYYINPKESLKFKIDIELRE